MPAATLVAAVWGLAALWDLAAHLEAALALLAAAFAAQALAVRALGRAGFEPRRLTRWVLAGALLLRAPLVALPATLSDDLLRYLWDGRVLTAGGNPYRQAPADAELAPLRDDLWRRLPHREVPTVYPPLALGAFSIAAALPAPERAWKALLAAVDLGTCGLLLAAARRRGSPAACAAWYAWSPLAALEVAGMGHVDALGVAAAVAAVLLLLPRAREEDTTAATAAGAEPGRRALLAGLCAGAGALLKLAPLAALPMWARQSRRPRRLLAAAVGLTVAGLAPVALSVGGVPPGLVTYGVRWEFDGALFEPLWRLLDAAGVAAWLAGGLDRLKQATGWYTAWNGVYPWLYPQLVAKALLALAAVAVVLRSLRAEETVAGSRRLFGGLLLISATAYPWYLLWVLPWAALTGCVPWLVLAATMPLSYLAELRGLPRFPTVWLLVWGPFFLTVAVGVVRRRRRHGRWR